MLLTIGMGLQGTARVGAVLRSIGLNKTDGLRPGRVCHGGLRILSCDAMRGNCDNCSHTPTQTYLHKVAQRPWEVSRPRGLENS